jgi:serine phosphatase RsbU (regulator of sigma subunit)
MTNNELPDHVNHRRRRTLYLYTILAMLAYQFSFGVVYLSNVLTPTVTDSTQIKLCYLAFNSCSLSALIMSRLKKQITRKFIFFILHYQSVVCIIVAAYMIYIMGEKRYLVLIGCQVILMFVFVQSTITVSLFTILFTVAVYLSASYIGIYYSGQSGSFVNEVLYALIFVPVCIFIAYMSMRMQNQQKQIKKTNESLKTTHMELESAHVKLKAGNEMIMESLRYAQLIQRSLLPGVDRIKSVYSDSMIIWMPKDIVGGDIFYTYADGSCCIIALMDCTGHGIPGAFLTMIVYSEIRKIIMNDLCRDPSEILRQLNVSVKNILHSNNDSDMNDGLDAGVFKIDYSNSHGVFAGARIPLLYVKNGILFEKKGDKTSLGYKNSNEHFIFTNHIIELDNDCTVYMISDGFTDQLGGERHRRFGSRRMKKLILDHYARPFQEQRPLFLKNLRDYQGGCHQVDDITLIGLRCKLKES